MSIKGRLRNWLLDVKTSAVAPLMSLQNLGQPVWTPRKYDKLAKEGYQKNIVAYKAIGELITAVEQIPWLVVTINQAGDEVPAPMSPLAKLLQRPNPMQGGPAFFGALCGYYQISGNSYIEGVKPAPGRPPLELYTHRPDRMKVIAGSEGPAGYQYTVGGESKKWSVEEDAIRHIKAFNPVNDWYGQSPLEAAAWDVDIHNQALAWNKSLLDNGAKPSGALVYSPRSDTAPDTLTDEQFERLKQQIEDQYSGTSNAGRPMLLEGGLMWQQFGLTPSDMDYINSKNTTARDIVMAFGVPPQLLGIPGDNTYSNMKEARLALWEQTVLPWAYKVRDELNAWLAPQFGDEYRITIDEDDIMALAPRREQHWDKIQNSQFLTINEKRQAVGYEAIARGDDVLVPANLIPVGTDVFTDSPAPAGNRDEGDDADT